MEEVLGSRSRFRRQVEEEWRDPVVTAAYRKWSWEEAEWGRHAAALVVDRALLSPGMRVLDIGSAHGEPGLAVAKVVGPHGHVTLTDIAPDLLEIAAARAREMGLSNVTTQVVDAHELPFSSGDFDRVTSRLSAMYFVDRKQAFGEALRVLKPGGLAVYLVWGPIDQPMFSDLIGVLFRYVPPPADTEPDAPSPFAFSESGTLSRALEESGFADVEEVSLTVPTSFPGTPHQWWAWMSETAAPIQSWMSAMSADERASALSEIHDVLATYYDGQTVSVPISVHLATGRKT